ELAAQRGAVDRGDDERLGALVDHRVDLLLLGRDVVARELQVDLVPGLLETRLHGVAVGDPALVGLGRHRDADQAALFAVAATGAATGTLATARGERDGQSAR